MENNYEKPIWHYTMQEFIDIQRHQIDLMIKEAVDNALNDLKTQSQKPLDDNIDVKEAARITGLKEKTIYSKVCRLEMPALMRGRPLQFSRRELELWMKSGKPSIIDNSLKRLQL